VNDGRYDTGILTGRVSGTEMRINVVGGDWQKDEVAKALRHLTVLPRKTKDGTGELSLPLTWAVVTQCARLAEQRGFRWSPGPDLNEWIAAEFAKRFTEYTQAEDLKFDITSLERTPMTHQLSGAYVGAVNQRFFFGDAAGTGKTMTALLTIAELDARGLDPWPVFVVTPASVVDPWLEELQACFPDWAFTAYRGAKRRNLSSRYQVYVMSWDVFRRDMFPADKADCERCGHRIEWTKAHQKAYEIFQGKGSRKGEEKAKADKLVLHHDCPKILPSKGYSVYRPIDTDKHELPPLIDFLVPRTLVLDEAHALCNTKTKQSVAAKRCARIAEYAFPMSGTPITRNVGGFWTAMNVLDIRSFPDQERFQERYCDRSTRDYGRPEVEGLTSVNREEFYVLMQGTMRRVAKQDVLKDLPDKTYSTRVVEIPPGHRAAYDEMEEDMIAHIPDTDEPLPVMNTLAQMQRLTQLASSACDVEIEMVLDEKADSPTCGEMVPHYKVTMREPCWKVDELMRLKQDEYNDEPLLVFAPHTQLVNIAGARAEKMGYKVGYITGAKSSKQKTQTRLAFQAGELDMLCANTSAGGVGLTLHRAHTSVFLERSYAFWKEDQAEDRTHRAGQTEQVHIIDIVAVNTIESRVRETLKDKAAQLADLVRDPRIVRSFLGGQKIRV
jgi:SNF2 family DNA or RNA helicase